MKRAYPYFHTANDKGYLLVVIENFNRRDGLIFVDSLTRFLSQSFLCTRNTYSKTVFHYRRTKSSYLKQMDPLPGYCFLFSLVSSRVLLFDGEK